MLPTHPTLSRTERDANSFFLPPDNVAIATDAGVQNVERDFVRYTCRAYDLKTSSDLGEVANRAINTGAIELNRSGLENTMSGHSASIVHALILGCKF